MNADCPPAPQKKTMSHKSFHKFSKLLLTSFIILLLLLKILFSVALINKVWSCCPKVWKSFSSHCYFTVNDSASWSESEEKCSSMGAHLLVIHSQEKQEFIIKILNPNAAYHIGLSDPGRRQWQWVDQTPYNENATFWHSGEPSSDNEQCVVVNHRYSGWGWNDIPCSYKMKSVC